MADGKVVFEVSADTRDARRSIDDFVAAMKRAGADVDVVAQNTSNDMQKSFSRALDINRVKGWALAAGKAVLDFGGDCLRAASDLEEVQNVVDVTFGEAGSAKIEAWAQRAGTQFGLTETQAKKFTSTLGAMMKSAGMAGPEIVEMSQDLAGLAADMASFYNLDFETAFQKIRSGISGETEPLKQLGVNMSVANLQAFALSKGIETTFDKMSQGEQTMLRYQYLMQATADAQGDFARTSDGYANATRKLATEWESLKTKIGSAVIPVAATAVGLLNDFLSVFTSTPERTVLDDFEAVDINLEDKIRQITATAREAKALTETLNSISGDTAARAISEVAKAAGGLGAGIGERWEKLISTLAGAGVIGDVFGSSDMADAGRNIYDLSYYLREDVPGADKVDAWGEMLDVLRQNAGVIADYAGVSPDAVTGTLEAISQSLQTLDPDDITQWAELVGVLEAGIPALSVSDATATGTAIGKIARAVIDGVPPEDKVSAWNSFIGVLSGQSDALSGLRGETAEETRKWLETLSAGASSIDPADVEAWRGLIGTLSDGIPGMDSGELGSGLFDALASGFLALGSDNAIAQAGLMALGYSVDEIDSKQRQWLETCTRLTKTIPGLSEIINAQTGEVNGGVRAVEEYITVWEAAQKSIAQIEAIEKKRAALKEAMDLTSMEIDVEVQRHLAEQAKKDMDAVAAELDKIHARFAELTPEGAAAPDWFGEHAEELEALKAAAEPLYPVLEKLRWEYDAEEKELDRLTAALNRQIDANAEGMRQLEALEAVEDDLRQSIAGTRYEIGETEIAIAAMTDAQIEAARAAVTELGPALEAVADYYERIRDETAKQIDGVISGFEKIVTPAQKARDAANDLRKSLTEENAAEINVRIADAESAIPSAQKMAAALEQQLEYINEYQRNLEEAARRGAADELLSALSDGSVESADYLAALATASEDEIKRINDAYREVQAGKSTFTDALTAQKLAADATFDGIVASANEMITALDMADGAHDALYSTVEGMAQGIAAAVGDVTAQVNAVIAQMERLSSYGGFTFSGGALTFGGAGGGINYSALGDVISSSAPKPGGNVYLDGRTVGAVVSASQGNAYRALQRAGVQPK